MERGNAKHSPRVDDELAHEVDGIVKGTTGGRAEEFREAEPPGDGQPEASMVPEGDDGSGAPQGMTAEEVELRSRFGRYINRSALPGDRDGLRRDAEGNEAPDDVLAEIDRLPTGVRFQTVSEAWAALGHRNETQRW
ncbi:hypothetical protein Ais01nite_83250 [Asanoa ishikariensis]|uniref:DUF2795 domain-containing protein n=1 Tax=Asanoa ishikariensis TaxID=137265 RepID=A0A1H3S8P4_9ACTN|nr:DUF2795 domain-containing protein [Asanoa ishikariensis]GIF70290.1 hypothetical protein Ais01nite_83250 [Asanoa ishikariensis]SDZ34332.1 Protein of unknown function [Asanoa ishikariensis]